MQSGVTPRKIDALVKLGEPDEVRQLFARHLETVDRARTERYEPARLKEIVIAEEEQTLSSLGGIEQRARQTGHAALDEKEAAVRNQAREHLESGKLAETDGERLERLIAVTDRARRASETIAAIALVQELEDPDDILGAVDDAMLSENPHTIRTVGTLALRRLAQLEQREAAKTRPDGPWVNPFALPGRKLERQMAAWHVEHPTPRAKLAAIAQERRSLDIQISERFQKLRTFMQLDQEGRVQRGAFRKADTPPPAGIVVGANFDR